MRVEKGRRAGRSAAMVVSVALLVGCADLLDAEVAEAPATPVTTEPVEAGAEARPSEPPQGAPEELGSFAFVDEPCPFLPEVAVTVDCGYLLVPESRTGLSDATIEVAVAVLRTPAAEPAPDPVVFLNGGPGGVSLAEHWFWLSDLDDWREHPILATRDLVLVDQRGTGYSVPRLTCGDEEDLDDCHDRLVADGITLAAYSTPENAADLAALRLALGYEQWNLLGNSYGTRLASAIVRDHPEGVRSMILDGVYPLDVVPAYHQYPANTVAALGELFDRCAEQPGCTAAYGDLAELFERAVTRVESETEQAGFELIDAVFDALYAVESLVDVPLALLLAADGRTSEAFELLEWEPDVLVPARATRGPEEDATGKFFAVECREEHAFTDEDVLLGELDRLAEAGVFELLLDSLGATALWGFEVCQDWDTGVADTRERAPLVADTPALVLSGRFDPITPPGWGRQLAANLTNATFVLLPHRSHSAVGEDSCTDTIVAAFLDAPTAEVDQACLATVTPPALTLP